MSGYSVWRIAARPFGETVALTGTASNDNRLIHATTGTQSLESSDDCACERLIRWNAFSSHQPLLISFSSKSVSQQDVPVSRRIKAVSQH